jgi:glycosyltransferase involved in cell wall biosynthesis
VLQIVGGGRWMARLAAAAPLVKGSCRIEVHGLLDRTRYVGLLASCQIGLVLPGLLNRFPLPAVASDYAAAGLAMVLAASGECAEMVTAAEAGLAANDAEPDNFASAIASLATNPPLLSRHRQAARRLAEKSLDREQLSAELVDWLESLATVDGSARGSD